MQKFMVRHLYNLVFCVLLVLLLPWLLTRLLRRGQWRAQFEQRFGRFDPNTLQRLARRPTLWLHAVSVGEVNLVVRLADQFRARLPGTQIVVSTTTTTGMAILQRELRKDIERIYYPLDGRGWVRRSLAAVRPRAVILVEAEIWPNFLWRAHDLQIPLLLVNARVSERSQRRYNKLGFVFRPLFAEFSLVCCACKSDAERLRSVGCRNEAIQVVGNLKFDVSGTPSPATPRVQRVLDCVGITPHHVVLIGGSTHPEEERLLGEVYVKLRHQFPNLFLIVAPRHFERATEASRDLESLGLRVIRRSNVESQLGADTQATPVPADALVVDTTGELRAFYTRADIVVMGKSFKTRGGQNPIEPAVAHCAVVTGPHMQNFPHVMREFLDADAVVQVSDPTELSSALHHLLTHPERRQELAERANSVVQSGRGALDRTVQASLDIPQS